MEAVTHGLHHHGRRRGWARGQREHPERGREGVGRPPGVPGLWPRRDLLLLALFLWACGFHFSSTTAGGDRDWLEAMLFSLSAAGQRGHCVTRRCRLTTKNWSVVGGGRHGLWDPGRVPSWLLLTKRLYVCKTAFPSFGKRKTVAQTRPSHWKDRGDIAGGEPSPGPSVE